MFGFMRRDKNDGEREVLVRAERPGFIYAVGDIHGCLDQLRRLDTEIDAHIAAHGRDAVIVYLGDYVDRGPNSAGVVQHLLSRRKGPVETVMLAGNHEIMMLDFLANPKPGHSWLKFGGEDTLASYGINVAELFVGGKRLAAQKMRAYIPDDHLAFLRDCLACVTFPGIALAHAGLRPGVLLERHTSQDMVWARYPEGAFAEVQPFGLLVHGHTPAPLPLDEGHRICVDTGAYATGVLTALCLDDNGERTFLSVGPMT